jgi:hypothetical protein
MYHEMFDIYAASGDDSCQYWANDGECDLPPVCDINTDATDCAGEFYDTFSESCFG